MTIFWRFINFIFVLLVSFYAGYFLNLYLAKYINLYFVIIILFFFWHLRYYLHIKFWKNWQNNLYLSLLILVNFFGFYVEDADKIKAYVIELWTWINIPFSLKILILSIFLILMLLAIYSVLIAGQKDVILPELFVQRHRELERVKDFINKYSIVTVDSEWGNGKTLLMDHFREDEKDNYIYIRFKPLSFDIRNITLYIISELQVVLSQNRVAQGYFNILQKIAAKNKWAGTFFSLFYSSDQQTSELLKQIITDC